MPNDWVRTLSTSVKSRSSEIPKTRYGITSGEKTSAETTGLPKNRLRRRANEVRTPSVTAIRLEIAATDRAPAERADQDVGSTGRRRTSGW